MDSSIDEVLSFREMSPMHEIPNRSIRGYEVRAGSCDGLRYADNALPLNRNRSILEKFFIDSVYDQNPILIASEVAIGTL